MTTKKQSDIYQCIYCLETKPKTKFNREHVLQKSFGKFRGSLTLTEEVCRACNKYFGEGLDRILGRDSFEALYRLRYGIKPSEETRDIPYERLILTIPKEGQGDWGGVRVEVALDPGRHTLTVRKLPQVGFLRKSTKEYVYFTLSEMEKGLHLKCSDVETKGDIKVITNEKQEWEKLTSLVSKMGISLGSTRELATIQTDDGKIRVKAKFVIDNVLVRGIAKVGFNYMAKMCGAGFALKDDFNTIRQFIRYGKLPPGELRETIEPSTKPLLANDYPNYRRLGHLLVLEWDITRRHVLARVSLFNSIAWTIMLAKSFSGLYRDIKSAHCYDIQNRAVKRLTVVSRELVESNRQRRLCLHI